MIAVGGADAFSQRWRAAEPDLRRALSARHRAADCDDVLQEAALVAWRRRDFYDAGRPFAAWAFGIVRRCRGLPRPAGMRPLSGGTPSAAPASDPEDRSWVRAALAHLSEEERGLLLAVHGEGLPLAQVAQRLGIGPRCAARRLERAAARLRVLLG